MNDHDPDRESDRLTPAQRAALESWAEMSVPDGFADGVMEAWQDERREAPRVVVHPSSRRWATRHTIMMVAAAAALLLGLSLAADRGVGGDAGVGGDEVRPVLMAHCAPCHDSGADAADPQALDAFDLRAPRWWAGLTAAQLQTMNAQARAQGMPDSERDVVARFVAAQRRG
jgi:hypothetical protein